MCNSSLPLFLLLVFCIVLASADPYYGNSDYKPSSSYTTTSDTVFSLKVPTLDETTFDNLLSFGYYRKSCPQFESILHNKVKEWIKKDYSLGASLMRLHFHDCSVRVHNMHYHYQIVKKCFTQRITKYEYYLKQCRDVTGLFC